MATRTRPRPGRTFERDAYEAGVTEFLAARGEEEHRDLAGLSERSGQAAIYERHADLFTSEAIDALRAAVEAGGEDVERNRALLAFAIDGHLDRAGAEQLDAIATAESRALIIWRGEEIPYRAARARISTIGDRAERNGLYESWLRAVEAINPQRAEHLETVHDRTRDLGFSDYVELVQVTRGWNPDELAARTRGALVASETGYYAAMRRQMGRADIEQGDGTLADLWYVLRGQGWDSWFEPRHLVPTVERTLEPLGMELPAPETHDPDPRGGWEEMGALLHEAGHLVRLLAVPEGTPPSLGLLGDASVSEACGLLLENLLGEPTWLRDAVGMGDGDQAAFADFVAISELHRLRLLGGRLIYELSLHRGGPDPVHRAMYAGALGLLTGVRWPEELYLTGVGRGLSPGASLRGIMLAGLLDESLERRHPDGWWRSSQAGAELRELLARGGGPNAERVVAHLGYDSLDWRPVLHKIRTRLIGEMSGYGGPNITTRAGTRKI